MKSIVCWFCLLFFSFISYAGTKYSWSGATSGDLTINGNGGSGNPALIHGDTVLMPAITIQQLEVINCIGVSADSIVILFTSGFKIDNGGCGFCNAYWFNNSYVKIDGLVSSHNGAAAIWATAVNATAGTGVYNIRFTNCRFTNASGQFSNQAVIVFEDNQSASSPMYFTGNLNQMYHDIQIDNCFFSGFTDVDVLRFAKGDTTRSWILNLKIFNNEFSNLVNTYNSAPYYINCTACFNVDIHNNYFHNFMYPGSNCGSCDYTSHTAWITLYGQGQIYNNRFDSSYANCIRLEGMQFKGLSQAYMGKSQVYNNIASRFWHYSFMEWSRNNLIAGNTISRFGGKVDYNKLEVLSNTMYYSYRFNVNSVYAGMLVDMYADSLTVRHNLVVAPEIDYTFDLAGRHYTIYNGNGTTGAIDSADNKVVATWAGAGLTDSSTSTSTGFMPTLSSIAYHSSDGSSPKVTLDKNGRTRNSPSSIGAVEYSSSNISPTCNAGTNQSIKLPIATASVTCSAADSDGSIASYAWTKASGPNTPTIISSTSASTVINGLTNGIYVFQCIVTDNLGATCSSSMTIWVGLSQILVLYSI